MAIRTVLDPYSTVPPLATLGRVSGGGYVDLSAVTHVPVAVTPASNHTVSSDDHAGIWLVRSDGASAQHLWIVGAHSEDDACAQIMKTGSWNRSDLTAICIHQTTGKAGWDARPWHMAQFDS